MRRTVLTFGLIGGAIVSALMLVTIPFQERIGFEYGMAIGYTTMVLGALMTYFGIRSYRDNVAGGTISFGRAVKVGLLISLVTTVCYVATWQFYYHVFSPDFAEKYAAHVIERERSDGASQARIDSLTTQMAEFAEMYKNPLVNIGFTFLEPLPVVLIFTFASAAMLRRARPAPAG